jgi:hypothetical protein
VSSNPETDDFYRYIESLQSQLHTPGWEDFHDISRMKNWITEKSIKLDQDLGSQYENIGSPSAHMEKLVADFTPNTKFSSPLTQATFGPVLAGVTEAAKRIGITLAHPVHLFTSTNVGASPAAMPTDGSHYLFIGLGTSSFCNYWAKAFTAVVRALPNEDPRRRIAEPNELEEVFKKNPSALLLPARLAFAYATYGSVIGFGQVVQPESYHNYRLQVLDAMEAFIIAHEFSHFVVAERTLGQSFQSPETSRKLEFLCDHLALQISREYSNMADNSLAFAGIGAILFFRAMEMSEFAKERMAQLYNPAPTLKTNELIEEFASSSHPPLAARVARLETLTITQTVDDQRDHIAQFVQEYALIASALSSIVMEIFRGLGTSR